MRTVPELTAPPTGSNSASKSATLANGASAVGHFDLSFRHFVSEVRDKLHPPHQLSHRLAFPKKGDLNPPKFTYFPPTLHALIAKAEERFGDHLAKRHERKRK